MPQDLIGHALPREHLTRNEIAGMYDLFQEHFQDTSQRIFERDLAEKSTVILLRDPASRAIEGFTTLDGYKTRIEDRPVGVIYSGDTIIRPNYWGTSVLPRTWIRTVLEIGERLPQPLYWLLISSGYKTYRFLSVFFRDFYPRYDRPTPPEVQATLHQLAGERFGPDYDRASGIVRFAEGATPLRPGVAEVNERRLKNPHVAFFCARNPGHARGDELVCLARIRADNLTAAGKRMVG
jgi:hypothetical protein